MISRIVRSQLYRFCVDDKTIEYAHTNYLSNMQKQKEGEVPIHLRPYDKAKYEVPTKFIKRNSGYALIQIEPFPRGRIMKICYNILAELKKDIPEDAVYRILTEEKMKYIMNIVDKQENIQQLQRLFGGIAIQIFIRNLARQFEVIEIMRKMKPWEDQENEDLSDLQKQFKEKIKISDPPKYPKYRRPEKTKSIFI